MPFTNLSATVAYPLNIYTDTVHGFIHPLEVAAYPQDLRSGIPNKCAILSQGVDEWDRLRSFLPP